MVDTLGKSNRKTRNDDLITSSHAAWLTFSCELRRRDFRTTRATHIQSVEYRAGDRRLFQYERAPGEWEDFELLAPARDGEPPRLAAPDTPGRPTLAWARDREGNLVYDITYH